MGEMKHAATDPRALAAVILTSRGKDVDPVEVNETVWSACGGDVPYPEYVRISDEVWRLVQSAEVRITWPDGE